MSKIASPRNPRGITIESEHVVSRFRRWLPAGETETGGHRAKDLVQFFAIDGGLRTVAVNDVIDIT